LHVLGRRSEAESYHKRAEEIGRDLERLRLLHAQMGQNPDDPELPYEAGLICLRNGQKAEARRWFLNVLQGSPTHAGARRGWKQASER
jgi:Flp pilus assembly protein TadD